MTGAPYPCSEYSLNEYTILQLQRLQVCSGFFFSFFFRTEQSDKATEIMICKSTLDDVKWTSSNGEMQYARHAKQPHE